MRDRDGRGVAVPVVRGYSSTWIPSLVAIIEGQMLRRGVLLVHDAVEDVWQRERPHGGQSKWGNMLTHDLINLFRECLYRNFSRVGLLK